MLTATALVLFMTLPGLALFYSGLVRKRNVLSVMMQCFAIACSWAYRRLELLRPLAGVTTDEETEGLDLILHEERGYDL